MFARIILWSLFANFVTAILEKCPERENWCSMKNGNTCRRQTDFIDLMFKDFIQGMQTNQIFVLYLFTTSCLMSVQFCNEILLTLVGYAECRRFTLKILVRIFLFCY